MSDLTLRQAAEKAVNLGRQLKAVIEVGEYLQGVVNLESLATEAQKRADEAVAARTEAEAALRSIQDEHASASANLEAVKAEASTVAAKLTAMRGELAAVRERLGL
jgi:hypothetical protein